MKIRRLAVRALSVAIMLMIWAMIAAFFVWRQHDATPSVRSGNMPAVAVLPFASLGTAKDDEYLAAGIHSELIAQLAQVSGLRVIARTSVLSYRNTGRGAREIGKELGVSAILEGSIQRAGQRVRVTAHLIDAQTEHDLWAKRYDRDLADLFAIETEVAQDIAGKLGARLTSSERTRLARPPTSNPEAYDFYLRGVDYFQRSTWHVEDDKLAVEAFEKATAADPEFALAHARLAFARTDVYFEEAPDPNPTRVAKVKEEIDRALALQPDLPEAHLALGHYLYHARKDPAAARREYELALRGAPGNGEFVSLAAALARREGRWDEALAQLERAATLDPRFEAVQYRLADALALMRRYAEAGLACRRIAAFAPESQGVLSLLAFLPAKAHGDVGPAEAFLTRLPEKLRSYSGPPATTLARLLALHPKRALEVLTAPRFGEVALREPFQPRALLRARAYAALGDGAHAREEFAAARDLSAAEVAQHPEDPHRLAALAEALASLGQGEEALREARRAVAMRPLESDAYEGTQLLEDFAAVAAAAGKPDEALNAIERLLAVPSDLSEALLRVDPRWGPLRGHPRFEALISKR